MTLLQTHEMSVTFGGVRAVNDVNIEVSPGSLVGLIGPNGAGKTSFIDGVTGFVPATGRVVFDGHEIGGLPAHKRASLGLGRTWQSLELFDDLTVQENLQVATEKQSASGFLLDLVAPRRRRSTDAIDFACDVLGIGDLAAKMPGELSYGQRKLVSAARALSARPKLICMDEPAAGLDTHESALLGKRLRDIVEADISILLVDHDMGLVLNVCDFIYVFEFGREIAEGTPTEIKKNPVVRAAYLGGKAPARGDEAGPP